MTNGNSIKKLLCNSDYLRSEINFFQRRDARFIRTQQSLCSQCVANLLINATNLRPGLRNDDEGVPILRKSHVLLSELFCLLVESTSHDRAHSIEPVK